MALNILQEHPELAKEITIRINGEDLMRFANKLIYDTVEATEKRLKSTKNNEEYLTRKEVSKLLKVSLVSLHHWDKKGVLKPVRIGKQVRYKLSDITIVLSKKEAF